MSPGRSVLLIGIVVLAVCVVALGGCGPTAELKFQPSAGDSRTVTIRDIMTMSMDGKSLHNTGWTNTVFTFDVEGVDAGGRVTINVTIDYVDLGKYLGMGSDLSGALADVGLNGKRFTMTVGPDGYVEEVRGMAVIVDEIAPKLTEAVTTQLGNMQLPGQAMAQMGRMSGMISAQIRKALSDAAVREPMDDIMNVFPESPVRVGSTWKKETVRSHSQFPMEKKERWKLVDRVDGVATLEMTADVSVDAPMSDVDFGGEGSLKVSVSGQETATVRVDDVTGWPIESTRQLDIDTTTKVRYKGESRSVHTVLSITPVVELSRK